MPEFKFCAGLLVKLAQIHTYELVKQNLAQGLIQERTLLTLSYLCLIVSCCAEDLGLLSGNGGVAIDQAGEDASQCLNTQGEGRHIKQEQIPDIAAQDTALNGGAQCHDLVRIDSTRRLLLEDALHNFAHLQRAMTTDHLHPSSSALMRGSLLKLAATHTGSSSTVNLCLCKNGH